MKYEPNHIYHIFNQGNNKQVIFPKEENYIFFLRKMRKHILPNVDFLAYCLMPNHFHWLVYVKEIGCITKMSNNSKNTLKMSDTSKVSDISKPQFENLKNMQNLSLGIKNCLSGYTKAINKQENRTGSLFRQKTKSKRNFIDGFTTVNNADFFEYENAYAIKCFEYIHQNPVKANLVSKAEDWIYSSAIDYKGLRNGNLCNKNIAKKLLSL